MKVTIVPIEIGAFGTITKGFLKCLEDLEGITENSQNTEKIPGVLRRFAVTQIPGKNHQLILM